MMKFSNKIVCLGLTIISVLFFCEAKGHPLSDSGKPLTQDQINALLDAWVEMWNSYDLSAVDRLFLHSPDLTYFSSEKYGIIRGIDAVRDHHRGFGFVEGGKKKETRLWLEDMEYAYFGSTVIACGIWFFETGNLKTQRGPVSFVMVQNEGKAGFAHLHFSNYRPDLSKKDQAVSLLGKTLIPPELDEKIKDQFENKLTEAGKEYEKNPDSVEALIWLGRRTAYLGKYREAIDIFSRGIKKHPGDARLYRHRGHRYITLRQFNHAIADLEHAARLIKGTPDKIEPDGIPNSRNIPVSSLHTNVWYHLGLAYYLRGDLENAAETYRECLKASTNNDMKVATIHWLYMTLRLLKKREEAALLLAPINSSMEVIENSGYYKLLLFYKGILSRENILKDSHSSIEDPAVMYGIANWYYYNNKPEKAREIFKQIINLNQWAAFGHIAAEARLINL